MYRIGVLYWSMDIPVQVLMREGLEVAIEEFNGKTTNQREHQVKIIPYVAGNGDEGIERQISQMYELIDQKVTYDQYISGRNQFCFYTPQMNDEIQLHIDIATRLQKALEKNKLNEELFMVYQPQVDFHSGKVNSCEA